MTLGQARAATAPELALFRSKGKWSRWRVAILKPRTIYTARVNQTFSTTDQVLSITFDSGSGTLSDVLSDMTLLVGSTAGAWDKGICRVRSTDATHFYIGETSDIDWEDNLYLTAVEDYSLWARHVRIVSGVVYMDGNVAYSDQHTNPDPVPVMGSNRVLKLIGDDISTQFDWSASYVVGGMATITGYSTSAPTAASISGGTTSSPTITFDACGWHPVYLTVTASNGKSFFGVRWVYVWNEANKPASVRFDDVHQDSQTGGWEANITMVDGADLDSIRDHALAIIFSEDHFDATQSDIGPVAGSENIEVTGWITGEAIEMNPEQSFAKFKICTGHHFLTNIPSFPDGVELTTTTPTVWTEFKQLTVDKGLWHMLHWRTTATKVMDVFLTGDTKYTKEVSSLASKLWDQIREMAWDQVYARAGCNAFNQLFVKVHPQLTPEASRTWATVMAITKQDWQGQVNFERVTKQECAIVSLSGISVNQNGVGASFFSISPGRAYPHYGSLDMQDRLLVSGQTDANGKAGLYRGWRNNQFPNIPIPLVADNRLIDCFPNSFCSISISSSDSARGISYSGNLIANSIRLTMDMDTGYVHREVDFEAETFQDIAVNGDVPGSRDDMSIPPMPSFPKFPDLFPPIIPGTIVPTTGGPKKVLLHDPVGGFILVESFNTATPTYRTINAGLTPTQYQTANFMFMCPNGSLYVGLVKSEGVPTNYPTPFIARAPSVGATFEVLYDENNIPGAGGADFWGIWTIAYNPLKPEEVAWIMSSGSGPSRKAWIGSYGSYVEGVTISEGSAFGPWGMSYGNNAWVVTRYDYYYVLSADCSSLVTSNSISTGPSGVDFHKRASTTGRIYCARNGATGMVVTDDNFATNTLITDSAMATTFSSLDCDPTGQYMMMQYDTPHKGKSSDFATTWAAIGSLEIGYWYFAYAGPGEAPSTPRFVAAGAAVKYSPDFGTTWEVKTNAGLLDIAPTPTIDMVRVLEY